MSAKFNVNPASVSFDQIKADLQAYLESKPDAAKWKDFFDSQVGTTIVEMMSGLGTMLKYDAIVSRREAFPRYAENRSSVVAYAESVGYSVFRGRNEVLKLTIVPNFTGVLTKFSIIGAVKDQDLVILENVVVNDGVQLDVTAVIGVLKGEQLQATAVSPTSFRFTQPKVSKDLRILLNTTEVVISERILDLINGKWAVQSNAFGSVDVMYLNLDSFLVQFVTGDSINLEYIELKNLDYTDTDVVFNLGTLVSYVVSAVYRAPEDVETARINAPLYNETQYVIRGRDDYSKVFRLLDPVIVDTSYRDISAAIVELFAVRDDLSLYSSIEKNAFIAQLSSFRPMGMAPPLIADPELCFLDLTVTMRLQGSAINPTTLARNTVAPYELVLGTLINFEDIEETIEDDDNVKIARVLLRGVSWQADTRYVRGAFVKNNPDNGRVYEMTKVLYFSGLVEPAFPAVIGQTVQDGDLIWTCCAAVGACDEPAEWEAEFAYELGAQCEPTEPNGFIYCVTTQLNLSNASTEVQHISFTTVPTSGTWRLEFGLEETVDFAFNANAAAVAAALNALVGLSSVTVDGNYGAGFDVTFGGADSNKSQPPITLISSGQNEINCIYFDLTPNVGSWQLQFDSIQTGFLAHNITNAALKTALEGLASIGVGNVNVVTGISGEKYRVEFIGALAKQPLTPKILILTSNTMTATTTVNPSVLTTTAGVVPNAGTNEQQKILFTQVPTTGQWSLNFNANTTALLNYNDSAASIQAALIALASIGATDVFVAGDYINGFTVAFQNGLGAQDTPLLTNPTNTLFAGPTSVDITFQTPVPGVLPFAGTDEVQTLSFPFVPDSGAFTLQYGPTTTASIGFAPTALDIQNALNNLVGLSAVTVTGTVAAGFTITFAGADGAQDQPLLLVTNNTLGVASAALTVNIQKCQVGKRSAQNLTDILTNPVNIGVVTTTDGANPEPNWGAGISLSSICP